MVGFHYEPILGYLRPNSLYTYIKYIGFGWVGFYDIPIIPTVVGYLMPNPLHTHIYDAIGFGMVGYYDIPTIVG